MNKGKIECCAFLHDIHVHTSPNKTELTKAWVTGEWWRERAGEQAKQEQESERELGVTNTYKDYCNVLFAVKRIESGMADAGRRGRWNRTGYSSSYLSASRNGKYNNKMIVVMLFPLA